MAKKKKYKTFTFRQSWIPGVAPVAKRDKLTSGASSTFNEATMSQCSCGGENSNCYKCSGTGYYRKKLVPGAVLTTPVIADARPLAGFSSDARGGIYGIREQGRFDSRPDYDHSDDDAGK
jgi:hypothetical protein